MPPNFEPIFLISSVRSGSTLLSLMLDSHSKIRNPGECDFLFDVVCEDGAIIDTKSMIVAFDSDRIFRAKQLRLNRNLDGQELINSLLEQLARKKDGDSKINAPILVMNLHRNFDRVPEVFPSAKYIHLTRDPRAVAVSCLKLGFAGNHHYAARIWRDAELTIQKLRRKIPTENIVNVRYEDLVNTPENILTQLTKFLCVEYQKGMLEYHLSSTYEPVFVRPDNYWENELSTSQLRMIESAIFPVEKLSGYSSHVDSDTSVSKIEGVRWYISNKVQFAKKQISRIGLVLYLSELVLRKLRLLSVHKHVKKKIDTITIAGLK